jgi:hypothetical protein
MTQKQINPDQRTNINNSRKKSKSEEETPLVAEKDQAPNGEIQKDPRSNNKSKLKATLTRQNELQNQRNSHSNGKNAHDSKNHT